MMGVISDALIRRSPDRISDTAPGRTPIAVARPPLVLPGFSSPRSIILISSMAASFPSFRSDSNSDYPNQALTLISEYQKLAGTWNRVGLAATDEKRPGKGKANAIDKLGERACGRTAGISGEGDVLCRNRGGDQCQVQDRLFPQCRDWPRPAIGAPVDQPADQAECSFHREGS